MSQRVPPKLHVTIT